MRYPRLNCLDHSERARHAPREIVVAAVGDLLMKPLLVRTVRTTGSAKGDAAYAFDQVLEPVARYLREADLTIGNLETTFAGGTDERSYTATIRNPKNRNPVFNCPDAFAPALKAAGFDVLATANNHCMDYGVRGLERTLEVLDKHGIAHVGTYRGTEESRSLSFETSKGSASASCVLRGTNGVPVPTGQPAGVKKIVPSGIKKEMKRLRAKTDFIIVCLHFGYEYHASPNAHQKRTVRFLSPRRRRDTRLASACAAAGGLPHRTGCRRSERKRFAIYSLGNFISTRLHGKDDLPYRSHPAPDDPRDGRRLRRIVEGRLYPDVGQSREDRQTHEMPGSAASSGAPRSERLYVRAREPDAPRVSRHAASVQGRHAAAWRFARRLKASLLSVRNPQTLGEPAFALAANGCSPADLMVKWNEFVWRRVSVRQEIFRNCRILSWCPIVS